MRHMNGAHAPNVGGIPDGLFPAVGKLGSLTMLHMQVGEYDRVRYFLGGDALIHVRYYHPFSLSQSPETYANDVFQALKNLWDKPNVLVSVTNELNLHAENDVKDAGQQWRFRTQAHYERIARFEMDVWKRLDRLIGGNRVALSLSGALAEGHDPVDGRYAGVPDGHYLVPAVRDWLSSVDVVGLHPYAHMDWQNGRDTALISKDGLWHLYRPWRPEHFKEVREGWEGYDPGGVVTQFKGKALFFASEYGTFTHGRTGVDAHYVWEVLVEFMDHCAKSGDVLGATPFIWDGSADHAQNVMSEELRGLFRISPRFASRVSIPASGNAVPLPPHEEPKSEGQVSDEDVINPHKFLIGNGFKDALRRLGEVAASDEIYFKAPASEISFAVTDKGTLLMYSDGTGVRMFKSEPVP